MGNERNVHSYVASKYDENSKLISETVVKYDADGSIINKTISKYNSDGKQTSLEIYGANDAFLNKEEYTYDATGEQISIRKYNENQALVRENRITYVDGIKIFRDKEYDGRGEIVSNNILKYDSNSNLISKNVIKYDGNRTIIENYDANNRLQNKEEYVHDKTGQETNIKRYNKDNILVSETDVTYHGNVKFNRTKQYDLHSNIIGEKIERYSLDGKIISKTECNRQYSSLYPFIPCDFIAWFNNIRKFLFIGSASKSKIVKDSIENVYRPFDILEKNVLHQDMNAFNNLNLVEKTGEYSNVIFSTDKIQQEKVTISKL